MANRERISYEFLRPREIPKLSDKAFNKLRIGLAVLALAAGPSAVTYAITSELMLNQFRPQIQDLQQRTRALEEENITLQQEKNSLQTELWNKTFPPSPPPARNYVWPRLKPVTLNRDSTLNY